MFCKSIIIVLENLLGYGCIYKMNPQHPVRIPLGPPSEMEEGYDYLEDSEVVHILK